MIADFKIPEPVKYNPLKHHRSYIFNFLKKSSEEEIRNLCFSTNHNYIDLYTGQMAPIEICAESVKILKDLDVFEKENFTDWILTSRNYRKIKLSDGSEWVVRHGLDDKNYIHIHPAKTGPYTIRFKGSTLKTVYCLKSSHQDFSLEEVNLARISIGLSPIKKLEKGKGIIKCWKTLFSLLS